MSAPSFGWVEVLHALSLGIGLRRRGDRWVFDESKFDIDDALVADLIGRGLVIETAQGAAEITSIGKHALSTELDAILHRTSEWLKTINRNGES
jgi:hypothetical protein